MNAPNPYVEWLDARETVTVTQLTVMCGLSREEIGELVEAGAIAPVAGPQPEASFAGSWVPPLREAAKLRRDFDLDVFTLGILLCYLSRIEDMERELQSLRAQMPAHLHPRR